MKEVEVLYSATMAGVSGTAASVSLMGRVSGNADPYSMLLMVTLYARAQGIRRTPSKTSSPVDPSSERVRDACVSEGMQKREGQSALTPLTVQASSA